MKLNQVISWPLQDLMESIKLFSMEQVRTQVTLLLSWKSMEFLVLYRAKTDGIGQNMVYKETTGKLGKNGH